MSDMLGLMLKGLGIDPAAIMAQASELGETFARLIVGQARVDAKLDQVLANQTAIMAALGLTVPLPSEAETALIEAETVKYLARHGGAVREPVRETVTIDG